MTDPEFPTPDADVDAVDAATLSDRIDDGEPVTVLDVRAESEYEAWHLDGPTVETVNVPYFQFLTGEPDDELFERVPDDERVTVLCAKGGASEYVAGLFEERGYDVEHLEGGMKAWARRYEYAEIESGADATVAQYRRPATGCLAYLVVSGDEAAVVDPLRAFADEYVRDAKALGADLTYAIDTHVHADHVSGVRTLAEGYGATPVVPAPAEARGVDYDLDYRTVADGDELAVGGTTLEVLHTPGHTTGMTAYRVGDVLFTGDGLFTESVARPDLEEGDDGAPDAARQLYDTLTERVLPLPDDTVVAPGHFSDAAEPAPDGTYTARLGELTAAMDALSLDREAFVGLVLSDMPPRPANYEDVIATNLGHQSPDDEAAFELELGPNNCAASTDALTSD